MVERGGIRKYLPSSHRKKKQILSIIDYKSFGFLYFGKKSILFERILKKVDDDGLFKRWNYLTIITCIIYALGKLEDNNNDDDNDDQKITFREIIERIIQISTKCENDWFRKIYIPQNQDPIDIISFYNGIFIPLTSDYIRHLHTTILSKRDGKITLVVVDDGPRMMATTTKNGKNTRKIYSFRSGLL